VPSVIESAGNRTKKRFVEYFTAEIRNPNTRAAYFRAVDRFLAWCTASGFDLLTIEPVVVARYIEERCPETRPEMLADSRTSRTVADSSTKQHLAAIRMLFNYLITGGLLETNPATSVRGPKVVVEKGKTPVLSAKEARELLDSIELVDKNGESKIGGLRDRALIGVMVYSFARIGATVAMHVEDVYPKDRRLWIRLHEKGGKYHEMPLHHNAEEYLDAYINAAGIADQRSTPLFRTLGPKRDLTENRIHRNEVLSMIKRRTRKIGLNPDISCHSFRATGITEYMRNGGTLEKAQQMAAHASSRTTNMYNHVQDEVTLDEVERILI